MPVALRYILFLAATLTALTCLVLSSRETGAPGVTYNISYGPFEENRLDLCIPGDYDRDRPGVLLIHGGGWTRGVKDDMHDRCVALAARGVVAAAVDYRLAKRDRPESYWPAQLSDVQLAMRWMRAHAKEFGMNPRRLCADGDSAGGHLAVFLGVENPVVKDGNAGLYSDYSSTATCVVDNYGMTDFTDIHAMPGGNTTLFGGDTLEKNPDAYMKASPLFLVSEQSAPMFIAHGFDDKVIPFSQSLRLLQSLTEHHVPVQLVSFHGGHQLGATLGENKRITILEEDYLLAH